MARTSNGGGKDRTAKGNGELKALKAPARRRTDKTKQAAAAATANDSKAVRKTESFSIEAIEAATGDTPSAMEVQRRAYELYVQRGCRDGHDKEDWFEAERQLRHRSH